MPKKNSLKMTKDEAREELILHLWQILEYWEKESRQPLTRQKLEGMMFSTLVVIDGGSGMMPAFDLKARVTKEDVAYHESHESKYFPPNEDLGGSLHDLFYSIGRKHGKIK